MSQRLFIVFFAVIIVIASFLRLYKLGAVPVSLYWDEMAMLVDSKSVSETGRDMHGRVWYQLMYPSYGDYKLPVYIWLASLSVKFFGVSEWALRFPSALAGIVTVLIAGAIAQELTQLKLFVDTNSEKTDMPWFPKFFQLATMGVVTLSPWAITFSRTGFEGHLAQCLVGISIWLVLKSRSFRGLLYLSPVIGALATYTYFSVRFVWPVAFTGFWLLLILSPNTWSKKPWQKQVYPLGKMLLSQFIPGLILFSLLLIPMIKSPLYEESTRFRLGTDSVLKNEKQVIDSNIYREIAGNTRLDRVVFHRWWLTTQELLINYSDNLSWKFLFLTGDPNLRHGTNTHGLFLFIFLPFFLWGFIGLCKDQPLVLVALLLWWGAALLPASVPQTTPHALRSLNALIPLSLIISYGMALGVAGLKKLYDYQPRISLLFVLGLLCLITWSSFTYAYHYFTVYPVISAPEWQQGYKEVALAIHTVRDKHRVYVEGIDGRFFLWVMGYGPYTGSDYQTWESQQYEFKSFDGIEFISTFDPQLAAGDREVVLATQSDRFDQLAREYGLTVGSKHVILDSLGQPKYVVGVVQLKL